MGAVEGVLAIADPAADQQPVRAGPGRVRRIGGQSGSAGRIRFWRGPGRAGIAARAGGTARRRGSLASAFAVANGVLEVTQGSLDPAVMSVGTNVVDIVVCTAPFVVVVSEVGVEGRAPASQVS